MLGLTGFNEAMRADRRETSFRLHAKVELVKALAIAIDLEVDDAPGRRFQEVDHCPDVTIGGRILPLDFSTVTKPASSSVASMSHP